MFGSYTAASKLWTPGVAWPPPVLQMMWPLGENLELGTFVTVSKLWAPTVAGRWSDNSIPQIKWGQKKSCCQQNV